MFTFLPVSLEFIAIVTKNDIAFKVMTRKSVLNEYKKNKNVVTKKFSVRIVPFNESFQLIPILLVLDEVCRTT